MRRSLLHSRRDHKNKPMNMNQSMNSELQIFDFQEQPVRILDREGQPWFIASDVCRVLEIGNPRDAVSALEDDEKDVADAGTLRSNVGNSDIRTPNRGMSIVSESGLYALIFKSRKPAAKEFRKWVTGEVLPEIRRKGGFRLSPALLAAEEVQAIVLEAMRGLRDNTIPVAKANAVFLGGRVYVMLSQSRGDIPALPAATPLFQSEEDNIRRVLEWMVKEKGEEWFTAGEMRQAAVDLEIWPWLTSETMGSPSVMARFGKTMSTACGRPLGGLVLRSNVTKSRAHRRFRVEVLASGAQQEGASK